MESVIDRIKNSNFWQFHGGIHPPEQKFLTNTKPIASAQIPEQLIIPIRQHIGQAGDLLVNIGDKVLKGQALTVSNSPMSLPIHAPTSGVITTIQAMAIPHPSGLSEPCIILTPDKEDTWKKRHICPDFQLLSKGQILEKIANAGIAGMGGAGFPSQVKVGTQAKIDYLMINAAECEPYITADDLLIQEHSPTILDGIKILDHLLTPKNILIGIEDNKAKAIAALKKATADIEHIQVCVIPTKYPSGGEKQLIKILTGQEVPSGVLPSSLGMVMQNVATCFAIADAVINDTPLIKRVVTVSGQALEKPQNVWSLIGTPVGFLTQQCGYTNHQNKHLIMGGPMMGFSLPSDQIPVIKTTNCILAPSEIEIASPYSSTSSKEVECIRCGQCADACPAQLLPQELQWSAKAKDQPQLNKLNLFDCIECGACAYVCPSQIPLVHYYRVAKAEIREQKLLDIKAEKAKVRFEARKLRLEREKVARAEKQKKAAEARKARMNAGTAEAKSEKSAVAAALARVKAKKAQANSPKVTDDATVTATEQFDDSKSQVANAIARAKAKKLAKAAAEQSNNGETKNSQNKASQNKASQNNNDKKTAATAEPNIDKANDIAPVKTESVGGDKKSKVAAAIAKAKAKKQQAEKNVAADNSSQLSEKEKKQVTSKKTKETVVDADNIAANATSNASDKKAKVAAAVAKAKLKAQEKAKAQIKATATTESSESKTEHSTSSLDSQREKQKDDKPTNQAESASTKKARVAAAIAKAKAKKLAASANKSTPEE
ncbi:MAG: electron transport complex subunit RsxC [Cognaticolwellia sp.]